MQLLCNYETLSLIIQGLVAVGTIGAVVSSLIISTNSKSFYLKDKFKIYYSIDGIQIKNLNQTTKIKSIFTYTKGKTTNFNIHNKNIKIGQCIQYDEISSYASKYYTTKPKDKNVKKYKVKFLYIETEKGVFKTKIKYINKKHILPNKQNKKLKPIIYLYEVDTTEKEKTQS